MAADALFMVKCDAPPCERMVEDGEGRALFQSLEIALAVAERADWLLEVHRDGEQKTYCPDHWHTRFGRRTPWWGDRNHG